ncbi:MAG: IS91 family transposase [Ferruginibacter sp.]|nr:IS91 family transposase [Ferruginibacter sp.]
MNKPEFELATIIKQYQLSPNQKYLPFSNQQRVLDAIVHCRTMRFGGHIDKCNSCSHVRMSYNSCRNRHCPKCQNTNRERWIQAREKDLLPTTYFHVVFTIPQEINVYCLNHRKELYNILFDASKETMETFAKDHQHLGAQTGMISILHTWGQNLCLHPHIHMIVPGGGITETGHWKQSKSNGTFLFPIKPMSIVFKHKFMEKLCYFLAQEKKNMEVTLRRQMYNKNWVVYAKQPFLGPKQVIEYLGRYTHKIAISNHRIKNISAHTVSFSYKDYKHGGVQKLMTLETGEFLRRFCLHILPAQFVKMRHYGLLASRNKQKLKMLQVKMGVVPIKNTLANDPEKCTWKTITKDKLGYDVDVCPWCKTGRMIRILSFEANAPPGYISQKIKLIKRNPN